MDRHGGVARRLSAVHTAVEAESIPAGHSRLWDGMRRGEPMARLQRDCHFQRGEASMNCFAQHIADLLAIRPQQIGEFAVERLEQ